MFHAGGWPIKSQARAVHRSIDIRTDLVAALLGLLIALGMYFGVGLADPRLPGF